MKVILELPLNRDLTDVEMAKLDARLKTAFPNLTGWSFSPITRQLEIDLGNDDEKQLLDKIKKIIEKCGAKRIVRFKFLEAEHEWEELLQSLRL